MRVAIITHSSTFETRAEAVGRFFADRGDDVTYVFSDFDHHAKATVHRSEPHHIYVHMRPFTRNLSVRRIASISAFSRDAGTVLDDRMRSDAPFDLLWFMIPANTLAPVADRLHSAYGVPVVFDIIDLWPESLPVSGIDWTPPIRRWRALRDSHLDCACAIFTECDRYRAVLGLPQDRTYTLYWYKANAPAAQPDAADEPEAPADAAWRSPARNPLHVAYLGAINNIIDIALIRSLLAAMNARHSVHLHIIGRGERADEFVAAMRGAVADVTYHGAIYDEATKNAILVQCAYGINIMKPQVTVGLSMKSIDYLYCGLPLLNTIGGDTWRLVEDQGIGVNVDRGHIDDTADFAVSSALDANDAAGMHQSARDCYRELFTESRFRAVIDAALRERLGEDGHARHAD